MTKQEYISSYLDRKMKNHGLSYGIAYYNLLAENEEKAEKAWNLLKKKKNSIKNKKEAGVKVNKYKSGRNFVIDIGEISIKRIILRPKEYDALKKHFLKTSKIK